MSSLIRPKPQETFIKYQMRCPFHIKARCGRCYCTHMIVKENNRCNINNCPFYKEDSKLVTNRKKN